MNTGHEALCGLMLERYRKSWLPVITEYASEMLGCFVEFLRSVHGMPEPEDIGYAKKGDAKTMKDAVRSHGSMLRMDGWPKLL